MALETMSTLDTEFGWDNPESTKADLKSVIQELQGLKFGVLAGANVTAGSVKGAAGATLSILTTDTIIQAIQFIGTDACGLTNVSIVDTADVLIRSTGSVKISKDTRNGNVLLFWADKSGSAGV